MMHHKQVQHLRISVRLHLITAMEEVSNIKPSLINVKDVENVTPNKALAEQINQADQTFRAQTAEVIIPNNTIDFKGERDDVRTRETNLGNAIADAMEAYGVKNFCGTIYFAAKWRGLPH